MQWYSFIGTDSLNPTHYKIIQTAPGCSGTRTICAIFTSGNIYPFIDYDVICYMVLALSSHNSNEKVILRG
ncbi:hypothetical protein [Pedobacter steynii]|uniref:Uncharacterized protein n=1 Tax=Pedobacter steynii TaxID=430522 RepID=A0A1D7QAQ7_9SPHI|nr:hypothetical protein [Pedobacter steynii]AOM75766.1 hypothetical protein BFS30_00415 [Pedobacter steynii]